MGTAQLTIGRIERLSKVRGYNKMLSLYFIAGTQDILKGTLPEKLEAALKAGITCFQYREKGTGSLQKSEEIKQMAIVCQELCRKYSVPFIVNDDVALALEIGADGIHVGQEDQNIVDVLNLFPDKIVGLSCYDEIEVAKANQLEGVSYYGIGPVYRTISKKDAQKQIGITKLQELVKLAKLPVVAIGGIDTENVQAVWQADVDGISVISALARAKDLDVAIEKLNKVRSK